MQFRIFTLPFFYYLCTHINEHMEHQVNIIHQNREKFNKTFLYNVTIFCSFKQENIKTSHPQIITIFETGGWKKESDNGVALVFKRDSSLLYFGEKGILLTIPKVDYQSFEGLSDVIDLICQVQDKLKNKVSTAAIVKINRYNIKHENNKGESWMRETLFSKEFNSVNKEQETYIHSFGTIGTTTSTQYSSKDGVDTIEYKIIATGNIQTNLKNGLQEINQKLFDVWRWSVSEKMIELMR